jgi:hypothetical protein
MFLQEPLFENLRSKSPTCFPSYNISRLTNLNLTILPPKPHPPPLPQKSPLPAASCKYEGIGHFVCLSSGLKKLVNRRLTIEDRQMTGSFKRIFDEYFTTENH